MAGFGGQHGVRVRAVETSRDAVTATATVSRMTKVNFDIQSIRLAADLPQSAVAEGMGMASRRGVNEMEHRTDWLLSRIVAYIEGCGGTAELFVNVNGQELRFPLETEN